MRDRIIAALRDATEAEDATRLCTLRLICAAIQDREAARAADEAAGDALEDSEVQEILAKMLRQREDSVRRYEESGRLDLAEEETREAEVIREFLPRPLSDDEMRAAIAAAIAETRASSLRDLGAVTTKLKRRYPGRMDGCKCGAEVRSALA